ncbi:DUF3987 domain-containing protein [Paraburkholderia nemoris]|uniref:DUF3987 domain-containing protein n=1 Tax=Paraburkholderia nemoris TaxID=2793076 RepID=UPI0038BAE7D1
MASNDNATDSNIGPYTVPPGFLGEIAQFIYAAAPRQVPEIALAGAIGLMAGICGRAYNISGTGLNLYTLLLAPTGTGKESMSSGISALMKSIRDHVPAADDYVGPATIASAPALVKYIGKHKSFVSILGEFGLTMQQMASPKAAPHLVGIKQILLDLFHKSGRNGELRPSIYSDSDKTTAVVQSPSLSILAESTPETFYNALNEGLVADGMLPRFTIIEYNGSRPDGNSNRLAYPDTGLQEKLKTLITHTLLLNNANAPYDVQMDADSTAIFDAFDRQCTADINRASMEATRQLWNRAHIKALRLAALVAVGCNPYEPVITRDIALWAIGIERASAHNIIARFEAGEIGEVSTEDMRIKCVIAAINEYVQRPIWELKSYDVRADLHIGHIVPYTYLHRRLCATKPFRKDGNIQPTDLLKRSLKTLVERGDIAEIDKRILYENYSFRGIGYVLVNMGLLAKVANGPIN